MSAYIQSYVPLRILTPPIPPTLHSQTAAPLPSPHVSAYSITQDSAYRALRATELPYPFPSNHVRRNRQVPLHMFADSAYSLAALIQVFTRQGSLYAEQRGKCYRLDAVAIVDPIRG